jgi:ABC-type cobalamin/Fe3+-siderophores transport system ATPase subunit
LEGNIVAKGQPESIVTPVLLKQVFNIESSVVKHPKTGKQVILL